MRERKTGNGTGIIWVKKEKKIDVDIEGNDVKFWNLKFYCYGLMS